MRCFLFSTSIQRIHICATRCGLNESIYFRAATTEKRARFTIGKRNMTVSSLCYEIYVSDRHLRVLKRRRPFGANSSVCFTQKTCQTWQRLAIYSPICFSAFQQPFTRTNFSKITIRAPFEGRPNKSSSRVSVPIYAEDALSEPGF